MAEDELLARLMATFLDELEEQVRSMGRILLQLEQGTGSPEDVLELYRASHNVKGAARAVGVRPVEELCHRLESMFARIRDDERMPAREEVDLALRTLDEVRTHGQQLRGVAPTPVQTTVPTAEVTASAPVPGQSLRVRAERVDALVRGTGELLLGVGRANERAVQAQALAESLRSLRRLEDAELRRALDRLGAEGQALATSLEADARLLQQTVAPLSDEARRLRMVPLAELFEGLDRVVRDVCQTTGKQAELHVEGSLVEMDRIVVEALRTPLIHLVRNAVDHGLERPNERVLGDKPRVGTVRVTAATRGSSVLITVGDDGRGMDLKEIRERARTQGLPVPEREADAWQLIFTPGFSTARTVTDISGRGMGLEIVRHAVDELHGQIQVRTAVGKGTRFTLDVPLTLSIVRVLLVQAAGQTFALPASNVMMMQRVPVSELPQVEGRQRLVVDGQALPVASLAQILGLQRDGVTTRGRVPVVILQAAERKLALVVDLLLAETEALLRPPGERLAGLRHISSMALAQGGTPTPVLSAGSIIDEGSTRAPSAVVVAAQPEARTRRVLLVDDSLTTRTLARSILQAAGYDVVAAVDGEEAMAVLGNQSVDLVVADVEMPRMDGIALTRAIRESSRLAKLPVVLLTALGSEADRTRGLQAGANAYLVKSSFDQTRLLEVLRRL